MLGQLVIVLFLLFLSVLEANSAEEKRPLHPEPTAIDQCALHSRAEDEVIFTVARKQAQKAWLEIYKLPSSENLDHAKRAMRESLKHLYMAQNSNEEANFIEYASDKNLASAIERIESGAIREFPQDDQKYAYRVVKQKSGTLNFTPVFGCTGAFSVPPTSRHYSEACKHVGNIEVGQVVSVTELPFEQQLTSEERVLMPDLN